MSEEHNQNVSHHEEFYTLFDSEVERITEVFELSKTTNKLQLESPVKQGFEIKVIEKETSSNTLSISTLPTVCNTNSTVSESPISEKKQFSFKVKHKHEESKCLTKPTWKAMNMNPISQIGRKRNFTDITNLTNDTELPSDKRQKKEDKEEFFFEISLAPKESENKLKALKDEPASSEKRLFKAV
jgi:hypothetical protein